jgi:hypothetical protein
VKELEARLAQYSDGKSSKTASLTTILEEMGYNIQRLNVSQLTGRGDGDPILRNQNSISKVADEIYEEYIRLFGPLPWLAQKDRPVSSHPDTAMNDGNILSLVENYPIAITSEPEQPNDELNSMDDQLSQMNENLQNRVIENASNVSATLPLTLFLISDSCKIISWRMFLPTLPKPLSQSRERDLRTLCFISRTSFTTEAWRYKKKRQLLLTKTF